MVSIKTCGVSPILLLVALQPFSSAGCVDDVPGWDEAESAIINDHVAAPSDLLGMVSLYNVTPEALHFRCSGMVISETTILTAAHCVCSEVYIGTNDCQKTISVRFRPSLTGTEVPMVLGDVVVDPEYDPSRIHDRIDHDLAIVHIPFGSKPPHALPFAVSTVFTPLGAPIMLAGFGHTGAHCSEDVGTLNWDDGFIGDYEADGDVFSIQGQEFCHGDSGGALLLADGTSSPNKLVGVISYLGAFGTQKATPTWSHYGWIAANTPDLNATRVPRFGQEPQTYPTTLDFGLPSTWEPITGDFNGDGRTDYARVGASGAWVSTAKLGTGFTLAFQPYNGLWFDQPSPWQTVTGDFNGDGRSDYARLGGTGAWVFYGTPQSGFTQAFQTYVNGLDFGVPSTWTPITGDFNGDGKSDYARLGSTGAWIFLGRSQGFTQAFQPYTDGVTFGQPSQWQTVTSDFNGDGKTDYARLGPTRAWVFTMQPSGLFAQRPQPYTAVSFGSPSAWEPITGDFNGDGRGDYGRVGNTGAYIFFSTGNGFTQNFQDYKGLDFGVPSTWTTIAGDFNGDSVGDYARVGSTGAWVFSGSTNPFDTVFHAYAWPAPAFGFPSPWQTITGKFNGGKKTGYARLGATAAWVFRSL